MWARRKARRALVQAAYQWNVAGTSFTQLRKEFSEKALNKADVEFFDEILRSMMTTSADLDIQLSPLLDRSIEQLDLVERGILRLAATEMLQRIDVPYKVIIDEYVELTKVFGSQDAHKYVNGVLDKLAQSSRSIEVNAVKGSGRG
jgi:N utilization substance protein B